LMILYLLQIKSYFGKYLMRRTAYIPGFPGEKNDKILNCLRNRKGTNFWKKKNPEAEKV